MECKATAWCRAHGFSHVDIANLFARRAYDPRELNRLSYEDAVGEHNDHEISLMADSADLVIAAWGQPSGIASTRYGRRVSEVSRLVGPDRLTTLERTAAGYPKHPQVWSNAMALQDWLAHCLSD